VPGSQAGVPGYRPPPKKEKKKKKDKDGEGDFDDDSSSISTTQPPPPEPSAKVPPTAAKHRMGLLGGRRRRSTLTGAEADEVAGRFRDGHDLERQMSPDSSLNLTDSPSTSFRRELDHELDDPLDTNDPSEYTRPVLCG